MFGLKSSEPGQSQRGPSAECNPVQKIAPPDPTVHAEVAILRIFHV
jgi:hypothetical protein